MVSVSAVVKGTELNRDCHPVKLDSETLTPMDLEPVLSLSLLAVLFDDFSCVIIHFRDLLQTVKGIEIPPNRTVGGKEIPPMPKHRGYLLMLLLVDDGHLTGNHVPLR